MEDKAAFYIGLGITGFLVPYMPFTDIMYTGLVATVFYDALVVVFYFLIVRKCVLNAVMFAATHIAFNWWLFSSFGAAILLLL